MKQPITVSDLRHVTLTFQGCVEFPKPQIAAQILSADKAENTSPISFRHEGHFLVDFLEIKLCSKHTTRLLYYVQFFIYRTITLISAL